MNSSVELPLLIVITGPTASGKTALAIQLAQHFNTEIISADSRQFYHQIPIGTAQPTTEELSQAKHHFIGNLFLDETMSAGEYARNAHQLLSDLFRSKKIVILCGGTGLYIKALLHGLDEIPSVKPAIREQLNALLAREGLEVLIAQLKELDPEFCKNADLQNPQRVIRALEVCLSENKPFSSFRNNNNTQNLPFKYKLFCLSPSREKLYERINVRVNKMIENGFEKEAFDAFEFRNANSLKTVGYNEWFDFFDGKISRDEAIDKIKQHTRNYAKRQLTWFRKMEGVVFINKNPFENIISNLE
jgi:tRNA dimethylallyltransferase